GTCGACSGGDGFSIPRGEKDTRVSIVAAGDVEVALTDGKPTSSAPMSQTTVIASGDQGEPVTGTVPAGATAAIRVKGRGAYRLAVTMGDRTTAPTASASPSPSVV